MSEKNGLEELAALVSELPAERRSELKKQLDLPINPRHCAGLVSGLRQAAEAVARQWPEAARQIQELVAVAAEHALKQKRAFEEADKLLTPEAKAEMDAEIARIESGEAVMIPAEDIMRSLREIERQWNEKNGSTSAVGS